MPPSSRYNSFHQSKRPPLGSASFESPYHGHHRQAPLPLHHVGPPLERPFNYYNWQVPIVEYITDIQPNDVLSGRGGATNSHSGNRAFRSLVKQYQNDYLKAKKRDKPQVAAEVVEIIREKGGRFLRRYPTKSEGVFWIEIGDVRAREKTCQALREGAPEIRRRKAASGNEDGKKCKDSDGSLSATSTFDRTVSESEEENKVLNSGRTQILRTNFETEKMEAVSFVGAPMVIRPSMTLICGEPSATPLAIPVDHLDENEREIYLRDFLPPNPSIQKKKENFQASSARRAQPDESRVDSES
eukprot:jgi/Psemu1/69591/estExt_Genemark1.C_9270014